MAYKTIASLVKLTSVDYKDFGKCRNRIQQKSWSKIDSNHLDIKHKVCKEGDKRDFRLIQNLTMGEANSNQFMTLRNRLVIAAENIARDENWTPSLLPSMSKGMDEQYKLVHKVVEVMDRENKKICVTLPQYNMDKPEGFCLQI